MLHFIPILFIRIVIFIDTNPEKKYYLIYIIILTATHIINLIWIVKHSEQYINT
jgi:hypothetical protein